MNIQALVDAWSEQERKNRAETQMTIGSVIDRLAEFDDSNMIEGLSGPHSYRGYYSDLALGRADARVSASDLREAFSGILGIELTGYKGGEFLMQKDTPVWVSSYGSCGMKLVGIDDDGDLILQDDDE